MRPLRLPVHNSANEADPLRNWSAIPLLRPRNVVILDEKPGGDAPKRMVRVYEYERGSSIRRDRLRTWPKFIAKTAEKWHPVEGVTEYLINVAGLALGLPMNDFRLYRYRGTVWFCSRYFPRPHLGESLIHGTEICGDYLQDQAFAKDIADDVREARELFTFEFLTECIEALFPNGAAEVLEGLVRILVFDCLLGNNDRHFYNWGVVYDVTSQRLLGVAPTYDSSRGLFWNLPDATIERKASGRGGLDAFIERYARNTRPRMTCEVDKSVNHFALIRHVSRLKPAYAVIAQQMTDPALELEVLSSISDAGRPLLSQFRLNAITKLVKLRFLLTREALSP